MSADFVPTLIGYNGLTPFRFWCQKVIPLVYDDSLSYYELLDKVVLYLNHVIEDLSATEQNVDALADAFARLQDYVNNYFESLDVVEAVNEAVDNEIDELIESGYFDEALQSLIDNNLVTINADIDSLKGRMTSVENVNVTQGQLIATNAQNIADNGDNIATNATNIRELGDTIDDIVDELSDYSDVKAQVQENTASASRTGLRIFDDSYESLQRLYRKTVQGEKITERFINENVTLDTIIYDGKSLADIFEGMNKFDCSDFDDAVPQYPKFYGTRMRAGTIENVSSNDPEFHPMPFIHNNVMKFASGTYVVEDETLPIVSFMVGDDYTIDVTKTYFFGCYVSSSFNRNQDKYNPDKPHVFAAQNMPVGYVKESETVYCPVITPMYSEWYPYTICEKTDWSVSDEKTPKFGFYSSSAVSFAQTMYVDGFVYIDLSEFTEEPSAYEMNVLYQMYVKIKRQNTLVKAKSGKVINNYAPTVNVDENQTFDTNADLLYQRLVQKKLNELNIPFSQYQIYNASGYAWGSSSNINRATPACLAKAYCELMAINDIKYFSCKNSKIENMGVGSFYKKLKNGFIGKPTINGYTPNGFITSYKGGNLPYPYSGLSGDQNLRVGAFSCIVSGKTAICVITGLTETDLYDKIKLEMVDVAKDMVDNNTETPSITSYTELNTAVTRTTNKAHCLIWILSKTPAEYRGLSLSEINEFDLIYHNDSLTLNLTLATNGTSFRIASLSKVIGALIVGDILTDDNEYLRVSKNYLEGGTGLSLMTNDFMTSVGNLKWLAYMNSDNTAMHALSIEACKRAMENYFRL